MGGLFSSVSVQTLGTPGKGLWEGEGRLAGPGREGPRAPTRSTVNPAPSPRPSGQVGLCPCQPQHSPQPRGPVAAVRPWRGGEGRGAGAAV